MLGSFRRAGRDTYTRKYRTGHRKGDEVILGRLACYTGKKVMVVI